MRKYMRFVTVVQSAMISKHLDGICLDILGMNRVTPAWKAMIYYFESRYSEKKFRGRRRTTLVTVLNEDIRAAKNRVNLPILESLQSLEDMRSIAEDRKSWSNIVNRM